MKYKDHGCLTISWLIKEHKIEKVLLDLGDNVNLLLYSVFQSLNPVELKPTFITLLLVDRYIKVLRKTVEYVLVQVDKFIFHANLIVFDT